MNNVPLLAQLFTIVLCLIIPASLVGWFLYQRHLINKEAKRREMELTEMAKGMERYVRMVKENQLHSRFRPPSVDIIRKS